MIRMFRPDDLPIIMDLGDRAWQPIYALFRTQLGGELFDATRPDAGRAKGRQIKVHCDQHPEGMLICERGGRVVGFCTLLLADGKVGEIGSNAVDPQSGEKGVGQELYQAAFAWFTAHGCTHVKVTTGLDEAHAPARRAYARAGFEQHCDFVTYYRKL